MLDSLSFTVESNSFLYHYCILLIVFFLFIICAAAKTPRHRLVEFRLFFHSSSRVRPISYSCNQMNLICKLITAMRCHEVVLVGASSPLCTILRAQSRTITIFPTQSIHAIQSFEYIQRSSTNSVRNGSTAATDGFNIRLTLFNSAANDSEFICNSQARE